ncbi:MAG: 3-dehydroquinate synthase [Armatimonadota bacterium]
MKTIPIQLDERGYDIHTGEGLLDCAGEIIARVSASRSAAIVTNPRIGNLYAGRLVQSLERAGISAQVITVPAGERYKTLATVARIYESFLNQKLDRGGMAIGLGGGIVGDMTGFAAATYLRGIDFIQVPTSLLAQVDASVGGKTGVNLPRGKNLVGAFHQPKAVIIDISVLRTLPRREFRSGLAEVIKHGIIRDRDYFDFIEKNLDSIMRMDAGALEHAIVRSCEIKADVVRQDERESGLRRILNYGHTVAHTVERLTAYKGYKHGEAVSIGMVTAALAAEVSGSAEPDLASRVVDMLKRAGLPYQIPAGVSHGDILIAMGLDKKVSHGKLHAVLSDSIGSAYVTVDLTPDTWLQALDMQAGLD